MSASIGPRGASFTIGPRGTYANISLPGTGISYRQRLDGRPAKPKAPSAQRRLEETAYEEGLLGLLAGRVREPIDWEERAQERRGRGMALRVLAGDRKVWGDVLQSELADEDLPFHCHFDLTVDERSGRIRIVVELPDETVVPDRVVRPGRNGSTPVRKLPRKIVRALYEDVCSALVLRLVYETYRVLPDADVVEVVGWRTATGAPERRLALLEITCGRWSFSRADLDQVDPSDLLESLRLGCDCITQALLDNIGGLGKLTELDLSSYSGEVDGDLEALTGLPFHTLRVSGGNLTDSQARPIRRMWELQELDLSRTRVTDSIGPVLGKLSDLRTLILSGTQITDRTLNFLMELPHLHSLGLRHVAVSEQAVQRLREAIPRLAIDHTDRPDSDYGLPF